MTEPRTYSTATSFRRALEERLKRWANNDDLVLQRLRRQLAFDRLLCRLFAIDPAPWVLKGGYAMELRTAVARSTKDLDLSVSNAKLFPGGPERSAILEALQEAASMELGGLRS